MVAPHFVSSSAPVTDAVLGLEDDEAGTRVVREELHLLSVVRRALEGAGAAGADAGAVRIRDDARLLELRDEVAVAKPEDLPSLFEQMHTIGALRAQRGKGATGRIDASSPYFGHLRLEEGSKRRDVLIGARSCVDGGAGIRIVDWRNAPVSRIYYRYQEGDDYEEELGDRLIEGRVLARRSVAIVQGELLRVSAAQGTFVRSSTGAWRRLETSRTKLVTERRWNRESPGTAPAPGTARLGVGADGQIRQDKMLPAIASMLDGAQFDLIARPSTGLVAIQGSAGSGKTTVGLHRVAYLAFADPQRFRPERILVVVPHDALVHYVGRVLPSLGLDGVLVVTFASYAAQRLAAMLPKLPTAISDETPPIVSRMKSHPAMLRAIDRAATRIGDSLDAWVREHMPRWPRGADVVRVWSATANEASSFGAKPSPDERVTALARWLAGKTALAGAPLAASLPDVTKGAVEQLGHELRRKSRDVVGVWDELLTMRERLAETFAGEADFGAGQLDFAHEWCVRRARVRTEGERDGETASLDSEDVALLLRIWQALRGALLDDEGHAIRFAHMFVDEVQDASAIELKVLLGLVTKEQSVTLAGDIAQRMFAGGEERGEFEWSRTLEALGLGDQGPHAIEALRVSYRSTAEITTFARGVLGPLAHDAEPIATRHGPPVELFTFASAGESVAWLADALRQLAADEPDANVALISRFAEHADVYFDGLARADVPGVRRVSKQDFTWAPGFDVTDVRQTKGLEFDEVVLLETTAASYPDTLPARHALYVGATRAAHQLWCVASHTPSPLVTSALEAAPTPATLD